MASRLPYPQDHASHLPILAGLSSVTKIRRVMEFGGGNYSTPTFLNSRVFPDLEYLHTVETDASWRDQLGSQYGMDKRFLLSNFEGDNPSAYDLVFIDNGPELHKIETIKRMRECSAPNTIFVTHDAEHVPYREVLKGFGGHVFFDHFNPATGVSVNYGFTTIQIEDLQTISDAIDNNIQHAPENVELWKEIMNG